MTRCQGQGSCASVQSNRGGGLTPAAGRKLALDPTAKLVPLQTNPLALERNLPQNQNLRPHSFIATYTCLEIAAVFDSIRLCDPESIIAGAKIGMNKISFIAASGPFLAAAFMIGGAYAIDETPTDIIAAQIRDQGYECVKPQSAKRDVAQSAPNETVWVLDCESGSYRVTLVPDLAAKVEKLNKN
jgi:hypothetical protein